MKLIINESHKSIDEILSAESVELDESVSFRFKIKNARDVLEKKIEEMEPIYGVTTGYGEAGKNYLDKEELCNLQKNLYRFHGCGVGEKLSEKEARLTIVIRLISLSKGVSGVSFELLKALEKLLSAKIYPLIPEKGSVGASGDLTPLSYLAATLAGEREAYCDGAIKNSFDALQEKGITPYIFKPKEALSIMNSTAVMSSIALLSIDRFDKAVRSFISFCAMFLEAMRSDSSTLHPFVHDSKPFTGQIECAKELLTKLEGSKLAINMETRAKEFFLQEGQNIQDRYSIRCIPQILGVALENIQLSKKWLEIEINSVSDNPLICVESDKIYSGCNFYGGYVAHACDTLKIALCNIADLLDKQFASLVDEKLNRGLGADLKLQKSPAMHGFKAMQITLSSLCADVLSRLIPFSTLSRSTESSNQDKVSMGTSSAISFRNGVTEFEDMLSIAFLGAAQALQIRDVTKASISAQRIYENIRELSAPLAEDRRLDIDIEKIKIKLQNGEFI